MLKLRAMCGCVCLIDFMWDFWRGKWCVLGARDSKSSRRVNHDHFLNLSNSLQMIVQSYRDSILGGAIVN